MLGTRRKSANTDLVQQWAIINLHRALEERRMIEAKRLEQYNKKMRFKEGLDTQLMQKRSKGKPQLIDERNYLQFIITKNQEHNQKQKEKQMELRHKRMKIQQQNKRSLQSLYRSQSTKNNEADYKLEIGVQSQLWYKQREKKGLKEMMDTLDLQLKQKNRELNRSRFSQLQNSMGNSLITDPCPNPALVKNYGQDERVYKAYEKQYRQRQRQKEIFYKKITEQAGRKIQREINNRDLSSKQKRKNLTMEMVQTLNAQVSENEKKIKNEKKENPQENSFKFIQHLFREKPEAYNKQTYSQQLRIQRQEQERKKQQQKFMSEEQYKINLNKLNKIVSGDFTHQKYVDRSIDNIGNIPLKEPIIGQYGKNQQHIKQEIEKLKKRRRSYFFQDFR